MLTDDEIIAIEQLILCKRSPVTGLEKHFLKVLDGQAVACSPIEHKWLDHWCHKSMRLIAYEFMSLRDQIKMIQKNESQEDHVVSLKKEIRELKGYLRKAHLDMEKYESNYDLKKIDIDSEFESCKECGGDGGPGGRCIRCNGNGFEPRNR